MTRLEIVLDFMVKAKKGEAKGPRGCLRKTIVFDSIEFGEAQSEFARISSDCVTSNGYARIERATVYNRAAWHAALANWKPASGQFNPPVYRKLA